MHNPDPLSPYRLGEEIRLSTCEADPYLVSGFSFREEWGRWTEGSHARMELAHGVGRGRLFVTLHVARAFCQDGSLCDVIVDVGWSEPKLFSIGPDHTRLVFVVEAEETNQVGSLRIDIFIVRPKQPNEPPDVRPLGVGIESFKVEIL